MRAWGRGDDFDEVRLGEFDDFAVSQFANRVIDTNARRKFDEAQAVVVKVSPKACLAGKARHNQLPRSGVIPDSALEPHHYLVWDCVISHVKALLALTMPAPKSSRAPPATAVAVFSILCRTFSAVKSGHFAHTIAAIAETNGVACEVPESFPYV